MSDGTIELDDRKLQQLIKAFKTTPNGRIGILAGGGKDQRADQASNAYIGAVHEYGRGKSPKRSFLAMPLTTELGKELEARGAYDESVLKDVMKDQDLTGWLKKVMICAEAVVQKAFDTGGFGKWLPSNMDRKKNHQTLVETQQLRRSITTEVK